MDLNSLPLPDYGLFPSTQLLDFIPIDVGRGCPFTCAYCVSNKMAEGTFRQRSVENVTKIAKTLVSDFKMKRLRFEHDLLTLNRNWILELCDALIAEELDIRWGCLSRVDTVDDEILSRMAQAGCDGIFFGIETGSSNMQKLVKKKLKLNRAPEIVGKACELGILPTCGFIVGFPQEHIDDVARNYAADAGTVFSGHRDEVELYLRLLVPFPGNPIYRIVR